MPHPPPPPPPPPSPPHHHSSETDAGMAGHMPLILLVLLVAARAGGVQHRDLSEVVSEGNGSTTTLAGSKLSINDAAAHGRSYGQNMQDASSDPEQGIELGNKGDESSVVGTTAQVSSKLSTTSTSGSGDGWIAKCQACLNGDSTLGVCEHCEGRGGADKGQVVEKTTTPTSNQDLPHHSLGGGGGGGGEVQAIDKINISAFVSDFNADSSSEVLETQSPQFLSCEGRLSFAIHIARAGKEADEKFAFIHYIGASY